MLPSILARELQDSVRRFLRATFPMTTPLFRREAGGTLLEDFLGEPGSLFKGPYLDLGLPFRRSSGESLPFEHLSCAFPPFQHQVRAFRRLSGPGALSTLVATGTGSGKTECFLYPILDHCAGTRGQGIKAIIIYPMNALANDQARRIAETIHEQGSLRGRISVGLYVGEQEQSQQRAMTATQVITSKEDLREHPPDILMTNYKMLDFLLLRPRDQRLWRFNEPGMLRYLVVDELHTFDGAQGTDLACLIRRLRDRLGAGPDLACVGTSATVGGSEAKQDLIDYAKEVFAADFDEEAVILEDRLAPDEFIGDVQVKYTQWPSAANLRALQPDTHPSAERFLWAQARLWFGDEAPALDATSREAGLEACCLLADRLRRHEAFHWLLDQGFKAGLVDVEATAGELARHFRLDPSTARAVLDSLVALVSAARLRTDSAPEKPDGETAAPFVQVRSQLWLRELRRLVAGVDPQRPMLRYADDLPERPEFLHLPVVHCRECHAAGWGAMKRADEERIEADLQGFYQGYFSQHPEVCLLFPILCPPPQEPRGQDCDLCPECGRLQIHRPGQACHACGCERLVRIWQPSMVKTVRSKNGANYQRSHHNCPFCGAREGLSLMGSRAASLSSVLIGELFSSSYNDHHKLIAFSDSVQDAAHRAGFFGARTYSTLIRMAIARMVHEAGEGFSLAEVAAEMPRYWRRQFDGDEDYIGTFIAPNMTWLRDYRNLLETQRLPDGSDLPDLVGQRLKWEVLQGFGLRARIGRTLERTRTAAVGIERERLEGIAEGLRRRLSEELESLRGIDTDSVRGFLLGLLWRMRTQGAFYNPMLDDYIRQKGKTYQLYRMRHMPNYGKASPPPAFLTLDRVSDNFENLGNADAGWYLAWFNKILGAEWVTATAEYRQAVSLTLTHLTREGLLQAISLHENTVWALKPEHWFCTGCVTELACAQCGHRVQVPRGESDLWRQLRCLQAPCQGHYAITHEAALASPYLRGRPRRIVATEHTALLGDEERHDVEGSFKDGNHSWDINLLSATPTLELGINIGDLSTILLCSVPPAQPNYIQRIGRAGRRDGNALAVTVANADKHDLFFYAQPREMMAGQIRTPGVFLAATAVLERQLIAYSFDRWAASGIDETAIPARLKEVLDGIETGDDARFPHNFLAYIHDNRAGLFKGFCGLFPNLTDEATGQLEVFLYGKEEKASIAYRLTNRLHSLNAERQSLQTRIKKLKARLDQLKSQPKDDHVQEEIDAVMNERNALFGLQRSINQKPTLNFFTDEGLLPNYAFPEEGVTLQSVILRWRERQEAEDEEGKRYYRETLEIQRPAVAALSELAPANRFYARGHVVEIDQVDLSLDETEEWRFCDRCPYVENINVTGDHNSVCPRCGSGQWSDTGQKRTLLRLRQVYAVAGDRSSLISDDSDQRAPVFYNRQMLVDLPPGAATSAYRLQDETFPFGFEFVPGATFREVNFGQPERDHSDLTVAGDLASRPGFRICRHCGKVHKPNERVARAHAIDCKLRKPGAEEKEEDYFDSLYLFRELNSEALRILLPLAEVAGSEVRLHSLIAALQLGLRRYFHGNIDHLHATYYSEPQGGGNARRHYLVLYDRIPGGTGYLKELLRAPDNLLNMLRMAHETLSRCECNDDPDKDGCYRCLYAYRESRHMDKISRDTARELLGRILERKDKLVSISGLDEVDVSTLLESELEHRFVQALANADSRLQMTPGLVNSKPGNFITITGEDGKTMAWRLEPQVKLGPNEGAALACEADFVFWPARSGARLKPVAVFMDGYQFHYNRVADDTAKRQALLDGGRFLIWNLGWHDLPEPGRKPDGAFQSYLSYAQQPRMHQLYDQLATQLGWATFARLEYVLEAGPFAWLLRYLSDGEAAVDVFQQAALSRLLVWLRQESLSDPALVTSCREEIRPMAPGHVVEKLIPEEGEGGVLGGLLQSFASALPPLSLAVSIPAEGLKSRTTLTEAARCHITLDDLGPVDDNEYERAWRSFWKLADLFQFAPNFSMASTTGVRDGRYVIPSAAAEPEFEATAAEDDWREIAELSFFGEQVYSLARADLPVPIVGYELTDENGKVLSGTLDLAWPDCKIGIVENEEETQDPIWSSQEWSLLVGLDDKTIKQLEQMLAKAKEA